MSNRNLQKSPVSALEAVDSKTDMVKKGSGSASQTASTVTCCIRVDSVGCIRVILPCGDKLSPGQDGVGKSDVFGEGARGVVAAAVRVGGGDHRAARLQRRHDASLGDRDALLLHRLRTTTTASRFNHLMI